MKNSDIEREWFQVALKTYFWFGAFCALFSCTGLACLVSTKYYYDQTVIRHIEMERDFRSYTNKIDAARQKLRDANLIYSEVYKIRKDINDSIRQIEKP